jgi:hypothetical protein
MTNGEAEHSDDRHRKRWPSKYASHLLAALRCDVTKVHIEFQRVQTWLFAVPRLRAMVGTNALLGETLRAGLPNLARETGHPWTLAPSSLKPYMTTWMSATVGASLSLVAHRGHRTRHVDRRAAARWWGHHGG